MRNTSLIRSWLLRSRASLEESEQFLLAFFNITHSREFLNAMSSVFNGTCTTWKCSSSLTASWQYCVRSHRIRLVFCETTELLVSQKGNYANSQKNQANSVGEERVSRCQSHRFQPDRNHWNALFHAHIIHLILFPQPSLFVLII